MLGQNVSLVRICQSYRSCWYGEPAALPVDEAHPLEPVNPYDASKAMAERMPADLGAAYGLHSVSLRYFNAENGKFGESIPISSPALFIDRALRSPGKLVRDVTFSGIGTRSTISVRPICYRFETAMTRARPAPRCRRSQHVGRNSEAYCAEFVRRRSIHAG